MEKIKSDKLKEILSDFEKEKSKHLIILLDTLHKQQLELPSYKIISLTVNLEKEIENYNKYNKLQLTLQKKTKSNLTTIKIHTTSDKEDIELCCFEMIEEYKNQVNQINDITKFLKSLNGKEFKLSPKRRKRFISMIEDHVMSYCFYCNDVDELDIRVHESVLDGNVLVGIIKKVNDDMELFSQFEIIEI